MRPTVLALLALITAHVIPADAARRADRIVERVVLPDYRGDWFTVPTAINNRRQIAGYAIDGNEEWEAFLWTRRGGYQTIAARAFPRDLNERGDVVGTLVPCVEGDCPPEGFVWFRGGRLLNLGTFLPFAINDRGDMAGVCQPEWQACVLRDNVVHVIGGPGSEARDINNKGDVVGMVDDTRAFLLRGDRVVDLGRVVAEKITDRRVIAGNRWMMFPGRGERAVLTAWSGRRRASPGAEVSLAVAINEKGWTLAKAWDANEVAYSFAWNPFTGARVLIESASGEWVDVADINDRGDVVGTAGTRAVIWRIRGLQKPDRRSADD